MDAVRMRHRTDGKGTASKKRGINSGSQQFEISVGDDLFLSIMRKKKKRRGTYFLSNVDLEKVSLAVYVD
jgi:hypothetical protein